jgi:hypothetical protein
MRKNAETWKPLRIKERDLSVKAQKYIDIFERIGQEEDGEILSFVTTDLFVSLLGLVENLRMSPSDVILVQSIDEGDEHTVNGLLCTDLEKEVATISDCFFVGEIIENGKRERIVMEADTLEELFPDMSYMAADLVIIDAEEAPLAALASLWESLERLPERKTVFAAE